MDDLYTQIFIGIGLVLVVFFQKIRDFIDVIGDLLIKKYTKKRVVIKEHEIFSAVTNYIKVVQFLKYSTNPYKQAVLKDYETTVWSMVLEQINLLSLTDVDKVSREEFISRVQQFFINIDKYNEVLEGNGLSRKTIDTMEAAVIHTKLFTGSLFERVLIDKVYDNNSERLWVIFTIMHQYLTYAHTYFIDALVKANGNLRREEYKGIINEGD